MAPAKVTGLCPEPREYSPLIQQVYTSLQIMALLNKTAYLIFFLLFFSSEHLSNGGGFGDQVVGTALLLICVCAINDVRNMKISSQMAPLYVGFTVLNIGVCFGFNCGYAINPARDLGPRIFTAMAGWGAEAFS